MYTPTWTPRTCSTLSYESVYFLLRLPFDRFERFGLLERLGLLERFGIFERFERPRYTSDEGWSIMSDHSMMARGGCVW